MRNSETGEMDIEDIVYASLLQITELDCQSWIRDSGLYAA